MKSSRVRFLAILTVLALVCSACGDIDGNTDKNAASGQTGSQVASVDQMAPAEAVVEDGMVPVYGDSLRDGTYPVDVACSSPMFKITACELTVAEGKMTAVMHMGGTGYLKVFMGTGEEATAADEADCIMFHEETDSTHSFTVPVEALDAEIACAAFSKKKLLWYDRNLVFRADSLPMDAFRDLVTVESMGLSDGSYTVAVALGGGSGKASVESPANLQVENGKAVATLVWSSPNYDYARIGDEKYLPVNTEGNSVFELPVAAFNQPLTVYADTTAMSTPHEIEYTLTFDSSTIQPAGMPVAAPALTWDELETDHSMELLYADQFSVDYCQDGYKKIVIGNTEPYLIIPEGGTIPSGMPENVTILQQPLDNLYLAATSAMDIFRELDAIGTIRFSGTDISGWYIEEAVRAMENGEMAYAGKYSAPDYELIVSGDCGLAVESTMIYHTPEVKEQLERLHIPVLVERSSYEQHPLGRMEWIKLYAALLDKEDMADAYFDNQTKALTPILNRGNTGKTVAFFYITSNGAVNVRKSKDYIAKAISLAGGQYIFSYLEDDVNALSTMNMQMESFYDGAKDADVLIYNSAIDGELQTIDELLEKSGVLSDFKSVQTGNVWCTGKNLFQESLGIGHLIEDIHQILTSATPDSLELTYLHKLS